MKKLCTALLLVSLLGGSALAGPTVIDFETYADKAAIGTVSVPGNQVTFSTSGGGTDGSAYAAKVGGPMTAFLSGNGSSRDTPVGMSQGTFLTDETAGPDLTGDYYIEFLNPVLSLSLDLLDYRMDGGPSVGDVATLTVYSDSNWTTAVGTDTFTVLDSTVDGNIETLGVAADSILSAKVTFSTPDIGTGIDNVTFQTIPAPGAILLVGLGSGLVGFLRRRHCI